MTDWSTAPPGPEMDAAVANIIEPKPLRPKDNERWQIYRNYRPWLGQGMDGKHFSPKGAWWYDFWDENWIIKSDWRPLAFSQGDLAAAFQVMGARDSWEWRFTEYHSHLLVELFDYKTCECKIARPGWEDPGMNSDRNRVYCVGICRCALLAAEGESDV